MSSHARTLVPARSAFALASACRSSPPPPLGSDNETLVMGRLAQVNPRDIVATGNDDDRLG